jgi:hypothetical protein
VAFAYVDTEGKVAEIVGKVSPFKLLPAGWRVLPYQEPAYDSRLYSCAPVQPVPVEAESLEFHLSLVQLPVAEALALVDSDVDEIYAKAIGNRGPEYAQAEIDAQTFKAENYLGFVPAYVQSWADAANLTPQEAADSILQQAFIWRTTAANLRTQRLKAKASLRAGEAGALAEWHTFVLGVRESLGV